MSTNRLAPIRITLQFAGDAAVGTLEVNVRETPPDFLAKLLAQIVEPSTAREANS